MKTYIRLLLFITLVAILPACHLSKDVPAPDMGLPSSFANALKADTAGIATIPYATFFSDERLKLLIDSAIARNNNLQIAVKNLEASRRVLNQAKLGNLPEVSLRVTATTNRPSDNSINGLSANQFLGSSHIEDYLASADLSWEADIWGKIRSQKAAALASYLQTEEARKAVQTQIVSNVSQGYYNLLMLDKQLLIARRNLVLNDSVLNIIKLQFQAGQVTQLAVQQAEAQRLVAAKLIPSFERSIVIQENALSVLTGRLPGSPVLKSNLEKIATPGELSAGVPASIVAHRPDVRQAELDVRRNNAEVSFSMASMYPSLRISAQGGLNSFQASNWFSIPASLFGSAAGSLTQPVFQRRQLKTRYELARIERDKSVIEFRESVLQAIAEVEDALVSFEKYKQEELIARQRTLTLQKAISNAQMLFNTGMANYLEIITAQGNVLQSELELAEIKRKQLGAVVELYRSVGGGWQ